MDLDSLYLLVSEAIDRAEHMDAMGRPGAGSAHLDASLIEEEIARRLPADDVEGAIARRGAVRHSISAGDHRRAQQLAKRFSEEREASVQLRAELRELTSQADAAFARCYPRATARFDVSEIRRVARAFYEQGMPFPVAG